MHLNILVGHNFQILLSNNDLPTVTNALFLLPMFCHCKIKYLFLPICANHDYDDVVKAIMVHLLSISKLLVATGSQCLPILLVILHTG